MLKGYRNLSVEEKDACNAIKTKIDEMAELLKNTEQALSAKQDPAIAMDPRWLSIGRTYLQLGSMAVVRSITKPETFA